MRGPLPTLFLLLTMCLAASAADLDPRIRECLPAKGLLAISTCQILKDERKPAEEGQRDTRTLVFAVTDNYCSEARFELELKQTAASAGTGFEPVLPQGPARPGEGTARHGEPAGLRGGRVERGQHRRRQGRERQ